ncbi:MAG TPA: hypothetical protein EYG56_05590 [Candidatus Marinimicrobia bacterium]|jgi:hypothetical protein|nr:hypothetical protein [Candidatus Neomarinimicrobiota bacterium]
MKWIIHLFLVGTLFGQMTLNEEDAIRLANNIKQLQFEVDSLSKIVSYQDNLFDIYKGKSVADDSLKVLYESQIKLSDEQITLLEKKVKLVKPSWYENKWLYFVYGAGIVGIPAYNIGKGINWLK